MSFGTEEERQRIIEEQTQPVPERIRYRDNLILNVRMNIAQAAEEATKTEKFLKESVEDRLEMIGVLRDLGLNEEELANLERQAFPEQEVHGPLGDGSATSASATGSLTKASASGQ